MSRGSDSVKVLEWRRRIERFGRSELSVYEFCQDEGVSSASFYQWRKRLGTVGAPSVGRRGDVASHSGFAAVRVVGASGIHVRFPGGTQMEIPASDPESLPQIIQAIARVDAELAGGAVC